MNQMDLSDLKEMIEGVLEIVSWNPTLAQLEKMQIELSKLPEGATRKEVSKIVYGIYKEPIEVWVIKGLDTSRAVETLIRIQQMQSELKKMEQPNAAAANNQPAKRKD